MVIQRSVIRRYAEQLSQLVSKADDVVAGLVEAYMEENPYASVEELRDYTIAVIDEVVQLYGDAASTAAMQMYDGIMREENVATGQAVIYRGPDKQAISKGVHYQARWLTEDDYDSDRYITEVRELTRYHVRKAANDTAIDNVERTNAEFIARQRRQKRAIKTGRAGRAGKVRYARVPTGLETCTYCTMLASRGFVYTTAESAGHAQHRGCNCLIVPGVQGETQVDGYDPDELRDLWHDFEAIDGSEPHDEEGEILTGRAKDDAIRAMKEEALRARLGRSTFDAN